MGKYFGTDGFRGKANEDLTAKHAFDVGRYLGYFYSNNFSRRAKIAIGKDARRSSYLLEYALASGVVSSGADAYLLHVTTTPSVSYAARSEGFDCGVMISASHNGFEDNGIKIVNGKGEKADEGLLDEVERYLDGEFALPLAKGSAIGRTVDFVAGRNRYLAYLLSIPALSFRGLRIGLDCANGSAWTIAKTVFDALGAETFVMGNRPDGTNINLNCGSQNTALLQEMVKSNRLDMGFAFDGDADRCIAVNEKGERVDGDGILYAFAKRLKGGGTGVVVTQMSNGGLISSLAREEIACFVTDVGDKYVYEEMLKRDCALGGETSGHIIYRKYAATGDGILTAILLTELVLENKCPCSCLTEGLELLPREACTVYVTEKQKIVRSGEVRAAIARAEAELSGGRMVVRASGTENAVRVLAEGKSKERCRVAVALVKNAILREEEGLCAES